MFLKLIRLLGIFFILIFFSCSGEPPQFQEVWWQLNLINDFSPEDPIQSLSLFIHAIDDDGDNDLENIYLINDESQLVWNIPLELWTTYTDQQIKWIGFNRLMAPGDGIFPEGDYRILLVDMGGERDEYSFYLRNNIVSNEELALPEVEFNQNKITVNSDYPKFQIWYYDNDGQLIEKSQDLLMGSYQWDQVNRNISRRASTFTIYTEPQSGSWGLISGSYYFK